MKEWVTVDVLAFLARVTDGKDLKNCLEIWRKEVQLLTDHEGDRIALESGEIYEVPLSVKFDEYFQVLIPKTDDPTFITRRRIFQKNRGPSKGEVFDRRPECTLRYTVHAP